MHWQRVFGYCALLAAWLAFAAWQYRGAAHERFLIEETLHQQSHSVMNALLGGARSHRRLGRFFEEQLQGMLDELVKAEDVQAVAILSPDGQPLLAAGDLGQLELGTPVQLGNGWTPGGYRLVEAFRLAPPEPGGLALGGGRGRGFGPGSTHQPLDEDSQFAAGGQFHAVLSLARGRSDYLLRRSTRSHLFVTGAAGLVLLCLALAWRATVGWVEAQGQTRLLETETRHWRELSQAAAGLAHETRNPLGLIRGWTQRLAQGPSTDPQQQQHARAVMEECDRVTARINQFLAFARPCEPQIAAVPLTQILDELTVILQPDLEAKSLRLDVERDPAIGTVQADRELLRQALFNLLQNAIHFAPSGDSVTIGVRDAGSGCCRIEVADRGPGVAAEDVDSLFLPYFTTRPDGTGLGLAIVRRLASGHGWQVDYAPRPGGGSVFALTGIHV
jgi:signal transduction histidine kinase